MNLFFKLHKWAHSQDENFTTEAFVCVLDYLTKYERKAASTILGKLFRCPLTENDCDEIKIETQKRANDSQPDIVVKAKPRPVMLIQPEAADMAVDNRGYRGRVQRKKSLVAPIFGLADTKTGAPEFSPAWVDRIRRMEFPQLIFLPKKPGLLEVDSIARLDELQSVFTPHLEPTQFALGEEMQKVLIGQMQFFFANVGPNFYTELRELLLKS